MPVKSTVIFVSHSKYRADKKVAERPANRMASRSKKDGAYYVIEWDQVRDQPCPVA